METEINIRSLMDAITNEFTNNAGVYAAILTLLYLITRITALIPVPVRWKHEYDPIEPGMKLQNRLLSILVSLGIIAFSIWISTKALANFDTRLEMFLASEIYKTPSFIATAFVFLVGIAGEICFGILCLQGIILLAQSEPPLPNLPDWAVAIGWALAIIVIVIGEILTAIGFGLTGIGIGIALLILFGSVFGLFSTSWLTWASFPNNWLRRKFCSTFAYWHLDFPIWVFSSCWSCLKWAWFTFLSVEEQFITTFIEVVKSGWQKITKAIEVVFAVPRQIVRSLRVTRPGVIGSIVNGFLSVVEFLVTVVETVVDFVVKVIYVVILVPIVIFIVIPIIIMILLFFLVVALLCVLLVLVILPILIAWLFIVGYLRLIFLN